MHEKQSQRVGDESLAVQAGTINVTGISEERAHIIAQEVVQKEICRFTETAAEIARARVDQLRTEIIDRIKEVRIENLSAFEDPDVQMLLLESQAEYARSGEEHHFRVLADLIAMRCTNSVSGLEKSAIRSAVETVGRLPGSCIAAVTICWLMTDVKYTGPIESGRWLRTWAERHLAPFVANLPKSNKEYRYLESSGCITITHGFTANSIAGRMVRLYPGLFQAGLMDDDIPSPLMELFTRTRGHAEGMFFPCLGDSDKWQVNAIDEEAARELAALHTTDSGVIEQFANLLKSNALSANRDVETILRESHPAWGELLDRYADTLIASMRVNSVGAAIAHCNWSSTTGDKAPLSIWV